jgi:hypothetical protein
VAGRALLAWLTLIVVIIVVIPNPSTGTGDGVRPARRARGSAFAFPGIADLLIGGFCLWIFNRLALSSLPSSLAAQRP